MTESGDWRGAVSSRRRAVAESEATDTEYEKDVLLHNVETTGETTFCSNCCSQREIKPKNARPNLLSNQSEARVPYKSTSYREEMEMKVLNDELKEQDYVGKQVARQQSLEDVTEMLKTLSIYAHCLDMRHKVSQRLIQLVEKLSPSRQLHRPPKETTSWTAIKRKLQDLSALIGDHSELPATLVDVQDDYRDRAKDLTKATSNFCKILQSNSKVSNTQLRKLELQYDEIKSMYVASKTALASHLDDLLETRIVVVDRCLQNIAPALVMAIDCDQEMISLFKDMPPIRELVSPPPCRVTSVKSLPEKFRQKKSTAAAEEGAARCSCDRQH